jgi:hypothetical protein
VSSLAGSVVKGASASKRAASTTKKPHSAASSKSGGSVVVNLTSDAPQYLKPGKKVLNGVYTLRRPPANKKSKYWTVFLLYDVNAHPEMKYKAKRRVIGCAKNVDVSNGSSGLSTHLRHHHRAILDAVEPAEDAMLGEDNANPVLSIDRSQPMITQHYHKTLTLEQGSLDHGPLDP